MSAMSVESLILMSPPSLTEHPASVYLSTLSSGSELTIKHALNLIARLLTNGEANYLTLNWAALRYKHTAAIRAALVKSHEPATVNKTLCALRRVLREALRLELISPVDYARAVDINSVKVSKELRGRALTHDEINALMMCCFSDRTPAGFRDAALIAILRGAGLRRAEAVNLDLVDFKPREDGELKIRCGKGRVDRTVYLSNGAVKVVEQWIEIRTDTPGSLLCHVNKAGRVELKKLSPQSVLCIVQRRGKEAGIEDFSPHDFRRTFISELLDSNIDISTVQKLAGHANVNTVIRYDRRGERAKKRAAQTVDIPQR